VPAVVLRRRELEECVVPQRAAVGGGQTRKWSARQFLIARLMSPCVFSSPLSARRVNSGASSSGAKRIAMSWLALNSATRPRKIARQETLEPGALFDTNDPILSPERHRAQREHSDEESNRHDDNPRGNRARIPWQTAPP